MNYKPGDREKGEELKKVRKGGGRLCTVLEYFRYEKSKERRMELHKEKIQDRKSSRNLRGREERDKQEGIERIRDKAKAGKK